MMQLPTATIAAPGSTALVQPRFSSRPVFSHGGPSSRHFTHLLPTVPRCHESLINSSSLARATSPSIHHPFVAYHASLSAHISLPPRGGSSSDASLHGLSSPLSDITLASLHFFHVLLNVIAPTIPHDRHSSSSVVPDGSMRSLLHPEMLSWPNLLQSQEAVIVAVGGG